MGVLFLNYSNPNKNMHELPTVEMWRFTLRDKGVFYYTKYRYVYSP